MFITCSNQAVVAPNLEYESLLGAPNDVESNDFIIDLYPLDRDPLKCLFVGRSLIYLPFVPSSRMKGVLSNLNRWQHDRRGSGSPFVHRQSKPPGELTSNVSSALTSDRGSIVTASGRVG